VWIKLRELDGSALLAFEAAERGWGVLLGNRRLRTRTDLPRGVFVERRIGPGNAVDAIRGSRALGRKVVAWCEEGLVYPNVEDYGRRKLNPAAYESLDQYFAWGAQQREDMIRLGCNPDVMMITGNPRFDVHRSDTRGMLDARAGAIREHYGPFILVNTNFPKHNLGSGVDDQRKLEVLRREGKVSTAEDEAVELGWMEFQRQVFLKFLALVPLLSRAFPEHRVVVRPHPSESHDPWQELAATFPNVSVLFEDNVAAWLLAADVSIHNNCTTGVEAFALDRPTVAYRPASHPRYDLALPHALSVEAFTSDDVLSLVAACLRGDRVQRESDHLARAAVADRHIANLNGPPAARAIVDALDLMDVPLEPLSAASSVVSSLGRTARRILRPVRSAFGSSAASRTRAFKRQRHPGLRLDELQVLLSEARRVGGRFESVSITPIDDDTFCVVA
jgi:surface carbohydrate biosynthesis protein